MKIAVGSDHAGLELKSHILRVLEDWGHEVVDLGTHDARSTDYPIYGKAVAKAVAAGEAKLGVVICGTGIGISLAANKVEGIRAANCLNEYMATMARAHNDANVLALGDRIVGKGLAESILRAFLDTEFEGGRHARRVALLDDPS